MLKFDPKNIELLSQKQTVLKKSISETTEKLKGLKEAQDLYIKSGGNLNTAEYRNLQREIINTENKLKNLKVEASNWTSISKELDNISNKLKNVGDKVSSVGKSLTTTVTAPIAGLMTAGVQYNAQIEKYTTALKTLTGSSEKARDVIEQIKKDAQATPFDVSGLTQANQLLISTGLSSAESREVILALGDAIAATGGGNEELSRMAVNLQQIKNVGKASAVDIKQFAYAGIDVYGLLADYLGITKQEASQMTVTWDDLNGALINASKEGGKYFGAMEEQSETFNGRLARLKESFQDFTGDLTTAFMPILENIMSKVSDLMDKFKALDPQQQEIITKTLLIAAVLGPVIMIIGNLITGVSLVIGVFSTLTGLIGKTTAGIGGLSKVMSILAGPVGIVIGVISALSAAIIYLYKNNEDFRNRVNEIWKKICDFFKDYVMPVFQTLGDFIKKIIDDIINLFKKLWKSIEPLITKMLNWLMDLWDSALSDILQNVLNIVENLIEAAQTIYTNFISPIVDFLVSILGPTFAYVFEQIWNNVSFAFNMIASIVKTIIGVFNGLIEFITGVFTLNWRKAWQGIQDIFGSIFEGLKELFIAPINWIISKLNTFINAVNKIQIPDWVPGIGGRGFHIPNIPKLAKGGIVDQATIAMIGEGKSPEAVIPLDRTLTNYLAKALEQVQGTNRNVTVNFYPQSMTEAEMENAFNYVNRKFGLNY